MIIRLLAIFLLSTVALILYFPNYTKLKQLRRENEKLLLKNKELEGEIVDLEDKLSRVGEDPYLYEKIARDELGVAKEGEIVIDIEQ